MQASINNKYACQNQSSRYLNIKKNKLLHAHTHTHTRKPRGYSYPTYNVHVTLNHVQCHFLTVALSKQLLMKQLL